MIEMTVVSLPASPLGDAAGPDRATAMIGGRAFEAVSRSGAAMALARELVAVAVPDQPWQAAGVTGEVVYGGPSFHRLAGLTVSETADCGPRFGRHQPFDPRRVPAKARHMPARVTAMALESV